MDISAAVSGRRVLIASDMVAARPPAEIRRSCDVRATFNSAVSDASAVATWFSSRFNSGSRIPTTPAMPGRKPLIAAGSRPPMGRLSARSLAVRTSASLAAAWLRPWTITAPSLSAPTTVRAFANAASDACTAFAAVSICAGVAAVSWNSGPT